MLQFVRVSNETPAIKSEHTAILEAIESTQGVIHFAPEGTILWANALFLEWTGYELHEVVGAHHRIFLDEAQRRAADYREFWRRIAAGEHRAGEWRRRAKNGEEVWLHAAYTPIRDGAGGVSRVVKFATNITEDRVGRSEARGQLDALHRSQAVIEFDLEGAILDANANFLETMGYALDDIVGRHHSIFVEPGHAESEEYAAFWADLGRGEFRTAEFKRIGRDGREVHIQASYNPVFDPDGRLVKIVKLAADITEEVLQRRATGTAADAVDVRLRAIGEGAADVCERARSGASASDAGMAKIKTIAAAFGELDRSAADIAQSMAASKKQVENADAELEGAAASAGRLTEAADAMGRIAAFIDGLASGIDILPLNATIEAARAGDAGRSFCVVAAEVKALARQVAGAAGDISARAAQVQEVADGVCSKLDRIESAARAVSGGVLELVDAIDRRSASPRATSADMHDASAAMRGIDDHLNTVSTSAEAVPGEVRRGRAPFDALRARQTRRP